MAEKKKILYIVEAMGGGVFTYIVDQERCKTEQCRRKDTHANLYDGAFSGKTGTIRISG